MPAWASLCIITTSSTVGRQAGKTVGADAIAHQDRQNRNKNQKSKKKLYKYIHKVHLSSQLFK